MLFFQLLVKLYEIEVHPAEIFSFYSQLGVLSDKT